MLTMEQLTAAYEAAISSDDAPRAGNDVREAEGLFEDAVTAYITAVQYEAFCWAYQIGYKAGKEAAEHEKA